MYTEKERLALLEEIDRDNDSDYGWDGAEDQLDAEVQS